MSRIMLRAYNAEAENCVKTVKAGNLRTAQARLSKAVEQIEKQGRMIDLRVSPSYTNYGSTNCNLLLTFTCNFNVRSKPSEMDSQNFVKNGKPKKNLNRSGRG